MDVQPTANLVRSGQIKTGNAARLSNANRIAKTIDGFVLEHIALVEVAMRGRFRMEHVEGHYLLANRSVAGARNDYSSRDG
ncbi:MAG TPA: hypothetical protein DGR97_02800 [Gammaproteobacteria bacterium]|nr:hypothetical protein [Gammaproteobacteria bacterium]